MSKEHKGKSEHKQILASRIVVDGHLRVRQVELANAPLAEAALRSLNIVELQGILESNSQRADAIMAEAFRKASSLQNFETITQNQKGKRSATQLKATGKAFSLGEATTCIAVGIIHENIGIAGSHKKTTTSEEAVACLIRTYTDQKYRREFETIDELTRLRTMLTTPPTRRRLVEQTTIEALEEFASLISYPIPHKGLRIIAYGMYYLDQPEIDLLNQVIINTLTEHPLLQSPGTSPSDQIVFRSHVGQPGELFYGGRTHPKYSQPSLKTPFC